jgi:hypothetical protein
MHARAGVLRQVLFAPLPSRNESIFSNFGNLLDSAEAHWNRNGLHHNALISSYMQLYSTSQTPRDGFSSPRYKSNNLLLVDERSVSVLSSPTSKIGMYGVIRPTQMTAAQQISGEPNNTLKPLDVPTYGQLNLDLT